MISITFKNIFLTLVCSLQKMIPEELAGPVKKYLDDRVYKVFLGGMGLFETDSKTFHILQGV
jgi:hypothetical protein